MNSDPNAITARVPKVPEKKEDPASAAPDVSRPASAKRLELKKPPEAQASAPGSRAERAKQTRRDYLAPADPVRGRIPAKRGAPAESVEDLRNQTQAGASKPLSGKFPKILDLANNAARKPKGKPRKPDAIIPSSGDTTITDMDGARERRDSKRIEQKRSHFLLTHSHVTVQPIKRVGDKQEPDPTKPPPGKPQ